MVPGYVNRLENKLNNPQAVIVVGSIALALNAVLYFGLFLPRMMPLVSHAYDFGSSIPEVFIGNSFQETGSHPKASDKVQGNVPFGEGSDPQAAPQASSEPDFKASALAKIDSFSPGTPSGSDTSPPPDTPSGLVPASTPSQSSESPRSSVAPQPSPFAQPSAPSRAAAPSQPTVPPQASASPEASNPRQSSVPPSVSTVPSDSSVSPEESPSTPSTVPPGPTSPPLSQYPQ